MQGPTVTLHKDSETHKRLNERSQKSCNLYFLETSLRSLDVVFKGNKYKNTHKKMLNPFPLINELKKSHQSSDITPFLGQTTETRKTMQNHFQEMKIFILKENLQKKNHHIQRIKKKVNFYYFDKP